jgi:3-hydroxymyristoyl/3-hydroxydecanoyl-(acyl carrier protein) dehydratase
MLDIAADALADTEDFAPETTATIIGMGLDAHIAEPVIRWATGVTEVSPALDTSRVQGCLPNFVANRISAQLDLRGPSYTVSAGELSGIEAIAQAGRLLATGEASTVVVGAVDFPGHVGAAHAGRVRLASPVEGAAALVLKRLEDASPEDVYAIVDPIHFEVTDHIPASEAEALQALVELLPALADGGKVQVEAPFARAEITVERGPRKRQRQSETWDPVLQVPHSGPPLSRGSRWARHDTLPMPFAAESAPIVHLQGGTELTSLPWTVGDPPRPQPPSSPAFEAPRAAVTPFAREISALGELAANIGTSTTTLVGAHERFLHGQQAAQRELERMAAMLQHATASLTGDLPRPAPPKPPSAPTLPPRSYDRAALERHASGALSEVFGPTFADLDAHEPRVRMPEAPLLLCDRVIEITGDRGSYGPARIVTEYDVPVGADWSADGRPPAVVVVESGQADLFLVSFLGIDEECKGERIYRLLDCDLTFHAARPQPGDTLRHDIRIKKFARLGATTLFYFEYDCITVSDGAPLLTMRNGCAGFFTPAELARPRGVSTDLVDLPKQVPLTPLGPPTTLATEGLCLPTGHWRLVHEINDVHIDGPPYGLGSASFTQTLRDDDWFNACHFKGDPCMPGTLMYDGCLQAVQLWLLAHGVAHAYPNGAFEPKPGVAAKLRCRGQVVPGHGTLHYEARIKRAGLEPTPWAIADVLLSVDGTPVVLAQDVGVEVRGERVPISPPLRLDDAAVMEFSVGSAQAAFGAPYAPYDEPGTRCPRMPGPPYLTMSRVQDVEGPAMEVAAPRTVVMAYDVHPDAWYFRPHAGESMPFAILLETALQPCGWLTAWQGQSIRSDKSLYFRNLGGTATQFAEVWPDVGTLTTRATQTSVSEAGGLMVQFYRSTVYAGDTKIFETETHFGYFDDSALANQKGLQPPEAEEQRRSAAREAASLAPIALENEAGMPRADWRMLDTVFAADPTGGQEALGFYAARQVVDPEKWFFYAHFHLDPVMPGSLGLEALLQLARWVLHQRVGPLDVRMEPLTLDREVSWKYRGQVLRHKREMTVELEVLEIQGGDAPRIRCAGLVRADGLPIYAFDDFGLGAATSHPLQSQPVFEDREPPVAALLDHFDPRTGRGALRLDAARHPWLADHCPTVTVPALPMAFAAEIAAEAAALIHPHKRVIGLPTLDAEQWIHTGEGPVDVLIEATATGDIVDVTLSVHVENPRFPALSGPKVHMRATVQMGDDWHPPEPAPSVEAPPSTLDIRDYYDGGHTFHGPLLQGMTALHTLGPQGATATFVTCADRDLLGTDLAFVLDPRLLDTATHPMCSAEPERWVHGLGPGHLAYPVHAENMRFFGPRPSGPVTCTMAVLDSDASSLRFAVHLGSDAGPWCAYAWTEAIVAAGPLLGRSPADRRAFLWEGRALPQITIGRATDAGWRVERTDLIEPLPGTLVRLTCSEAEVERWRSADDRAEWAMARIAAKEAIRQWIHLRTGIALHPRDLVLLAMRPDRYVVIEAGPLDAQTFSEHIGPTRFDVIVKTTETCAIAQISPLSIRPS